MATPSSAKRRLVVQPPSKYDWQFRVHWEFKPLDCLTGDEVEVVLPEAEAVSERRRARVRLPSGKILRVASSVLLKYCHALKDYGAELLNGVVWLTYTPARFEWEDWVVEGFFSDLHKDRLEKGHIGHTGVYHQYGPLSHALDVPAAKSRFKGIAELVLHYTGDKAKPPHQYFRWLGAYQLFSEPWAAYALEGLHKLSAEKFKTFLEEAHRPMLLEAFSTTEIMQLAYARWLYPPICLTAGM